MPKRLTHAIGLFALAGIVAGCAAFESNTLGETRIETEFQENSVERLEAAQPVIDKLAKAGFKPETTQRIVASLTRPLPSRMRSPTARIRRRSTGASTSPRVPRPTVPTTSSPRIRRRSRRRSPKRPATMRSRRSRPRSLAASRV
jgi:hypothetical protein